MGPQLMKPEGRDGARGGADAGGANGGRRHVRAPGQPREADGGARVPVGTPEQRPAEASPAQVHCSALLTGPRGPWADCWGRVPGQQP